MTRDACDLLSVGTAGWAIPRPLAERLSGDGTHLQRYARQLNCCEINSSFHRAHATTQYAKWAAATPPGFRFAVKLPRLMTHELGLRTPRLPLDRFLAETDGLGARRGPLLVQLPPSHAFDARLVRRFFDHVRHRYEGPLVCEPRHPTWFCERAGRLLEDYIVSRVAADPACAAGADAPGGWRGIQYFRLHGSPRVYWSRYTPSFIAQLAHVLAAAAASAKVWCVFDNTAAGAALENALQLQVAVLALDRRRRSAAAVPTSA
jgi:uncharacterized protein YecE (DUF72 family)